ncbi:hypothetical protein AWH51_01670 [Clavibacter tessellarius]|uniref:Ribbon-helix-helix protein CopG domain-containing protein n=2 Tax=Microbacteriaceae TaxID=85023 RepID=A0A154UXI6_9MICO|nr:hypothetical protein AWH51_01670 [Clavibacter michiganensis subsp. tessellarius]
MEDGWPIRRAAERGELAPIPGTERTHVDDPDAGAGDLMAATGADTLDDDAEIALGRPRVDAPPTSGPLWRVRATAALDAEVEALAERRGHRNKSRIIREAAAPYVRASRSGARSGHDADNGQHPVRT